MASLNVELNQAAEFFGRFERFGGTKSLLKRLLTDDERMEAWVQSALENAPVEHLTASVSYQLPSFAELNGTSFDWASDLFSDRYTWEEHESVRGRVDRTPGERSFLVKHFNKNMMSEDVITWADKNGYRVATHEEAVDFAKAHPNLQRQFPIVVLGSFTVGGGYRCVAFLHRDGAGRSLGGDWFAYGWHARDRFLLVRK